MSDPATPNVEVKLCLRPDRVLDGDHRLLPAVADFFGAGHAVTRLRMAFLDGRELALHPAGWDVRLRKHEGEPALELTYKRRYPVPDGCLEPVLAQAAADGFDADELDYAAQVEWGLGKQTLSFSRVKSAGHAGPGGMALPDAAEARRIAVTALPGKLDRARRPGWACGILGDAHVYGPVDGRRWRGGRPDVDDHIDVEVWEIRGTGALAPEVLVEVSFKAKEPVKAGPRREALKDELQRRGWLLDEDVLKTDLILTRYGPG